MRTSKTISISLPPAQLKQAERLAKKENRTMSELIREALRRYQQIRESDENPINAELLAALRLVQRDAARTGLNKTTMREIDTEIAAYKSEKGAKDAKRRVR